MKFSLKQVRICMLSLAVLSMLSVVGSQSIAATTARDTVHTCTAAEVSQYFGHGELRLQSLQPDYQYLADFRSDGTFTMTRNFADQFNNNQTANIGPVRAAQKILSGFGVWSQQGTAIHTSFIRPVQQSSKLTLSDYAPELLKIVELRCAADSGLLVVFGSGDAAVVIPRNADVIL